MGDLLLDSRGGEKMDQKEFKVKYEKEIRQMAQAQNVDLGVASAMLIAHAKQRIEAEKNFIYNFPEAKQLDLVELDKDISDMENKAAELREQYGFDF